MVYDRRIDQINRENNQLTDKIEDRLEILTRQRDEIIQCEIEENKLVRQIEDDKNSFLERQMLNKIRYEELEKKFVNLQKRVVEIQLGEKIRKAEMRQVNLRPSTSYKNLNNDLDYKLQIAESDNNQLEQRLMELTNEWTVLLREHSPNRKCCTGKI